MRAVVTGASGFIGGHLCRYLKEQGHWVRAVDVALPRYGDIECDSFDQLDLREYRNARVATGGVDWVFGLAADMGGAGFVFTGVNDADILVNNALININTIKAAEANGVERYFYSSSACAYPDSIQQELDSPPLREEDAYPAAPGSEYGWEKIFTERLCGTYQRLKPMEMRVARFHNIMGEKCEWKGGREKAPAAMCRKVAAAKLLGEPTVEIWGDGLTVRSYMHVQDCVEAVYALMLSDYSGPLNIGSDFGVSVNEMVDIICATAKVYLTKTYVPGPEGVRGRNADLSLVREVLGWEPRISLGDGLARLYRWVEGQVKADLTSS